MKSPRLHLVAALTVCSAVIVWLGLSRVKKVQVELNLVTRWVQLVLAPQATYNGEATPLLCLSTLDHVELADVQRVAASPHVKAAVPALDALKPGDGLYVQRSKDPASRLGLGHVELAGADTIELFANTHSKFVVGNRASGVHPLLVQLTTDDARDYQVLMVKGASIATSPEHRNEVRAAKSTLNATLPRTAAIRLWSKNLRNEILCRDELKVSALRMARVDPGYATSALVKAHLVFSGGRTTDLQDGSWLELGDAVGVVKRPQLDETGNLKLSFLGEVNRLRHGGAYETAVDAMPSRLEQLRDNPTWTSITGVLLSVITLVVAAFRWWRTEA